MFFFGAKAKLQPHGTVYFLADGKETAVMDVLIEKWSGELPTNFAPNINFFKINNKTLMRVLNVIENRF